MTGREQTGGGGCIIGGGVQNCFGGGVLWYVFPECTKIAHRRSLAIFAADEGIAGNSAARTILPILFAEEIAVR